MNDMRTPGGMDGELADRHHKSLLNEKFTQHVKMYLKKNDPRFDVNKEKEGVERVIMKATDAVFKKMMEKRQLNELPDFLKRTNLITQQKAKVDTNPNGFPALT